MEQNKSIEHVLEDMDKSIIYKAKKSPLRIFLLFLGGIVFFVINAAVVWEANSMVSPLLIVLGSTTIIAGIILLAFQKDHYVFAESHQRLNNSEMYFHVNERDKLVRLIESGNLKGIKDLKLSVSDGLKLRVMVTKDGQICLSQVIAYSSNEYVNTTPVQSHSLEDARFIQALFQQNK